MNAAINPKYGFVKTFDRILFTRTTEKMRYCRPGEPLEAVKEKTVLSFTACTPHS
jgi:hypothetical protein